MLGRSQAIDRTPDRFGLEERLVPDRHDVGKPSAELLGIDGSLHVHLELTHSVHAGNPAIARARLEGGTGLLIQPPFCVKMGGLWP
jgi:hypothetical protein